MQKKKHYQVINEDHTFQNQDDHINVYSLFNFNFPTTI